MILVYEDSASKSFLDKLAEVFHIAKATNNQDLSRLTDYSKYMRVVAKIISGILANSLERDVELIYEDKKLHLQLQTILTQNQKQENQVDLVTQMKLEKICMLGFADFLEAIRNYEDEETKD